MIYKRGKRWHMDVVISGVRYREALDTTDKREAPGLMNKRIAEIQAGKGASKTGREFARKPFGEAADLFLEERKPHVAERTHQLEGNLLTPLRKFFGERVLLRIRAEDIAGYQRMRRATGISGRTLNMEIAVLRAMMKRAKVWSIVAEDVKLDRENTHVIGRVLNKEDKETLFKTAATKEEWLVVYCAAVLAVSTTCRGIELKHLRWSDVDLFARTMMIRRSKTQSGHRTIPLNPDALAAFGRLRKQAEALGFGAPEHFVYPACERQRFDPTRPQKTWRSAWRSLVDAAGEKAGEKAAKRAVKAGADPEEARTRAIASFVSEKGVRLRFHDLRHQEITELAENGASDATVMAVAGHLSREMMEHYSHVRMAAKREALENLSHGLITAPEPDLKPASDAVQ